MAANLKFRPSRPRPEIHEFGSSSFFRRCLHTGSLFVVLVVFRSEIFKILRAVARFDFKSEEGKLALYVILGSIATAVIGFLFRDLV